MWISRDKYENLKVDVDFWRVRYDTQNDLTKELLKIADEHCSTICKLQDQIKQLEVYKSEAQEYKQKYADEVQKRLELVKLLENTP